MPNFMLRVWEAFRRYEEYHGVTLPQSAKTVGKEAVRGIQSYKPFSSENFNVPGDIEHPRIYDENAEEYRRRSR
ncbi:uncharacterized protein BYT42DRAFT_614123 [Radiomyces spectabilis]|uniref:uncharacterized protein n=1 Tax=Radiomyces spectabilis TaxID=64574 RepID=UPI002220513B|nr:uncharacterized protein BYT42DRAFT_614123 [Radiomyces spectabilis]KAI8377436.1 hypothetical protein BYT42DRAFT_614123 [Radiomyces spectabilis]